MKSILKFMVILGFFFGGIFSATTVYGQAIKSKKTWGKGKRTVIKQSQFQEIEEELADLEELAEEEQLYDGEEVYEGEEIADAEYVDSSSSSSRKTKKSRKSKKVTRKSGPGKKKTVIKRIVRRKPRTTTTRSVVRLPQLPKKRKSLFHFTPTFGATLMCVGGDLLTNSFVNDVTYEFGFTAGIMMEFRRNRSIWGIESGIQYVQNGTLGESTLGVSGARLDYLLNQYIYVPLVGKLYPVRTDGFEMYMKAGVMGGYLLESEMEGISATNVRFNRDSLEDFSDFDFQGTVGLGARFRVTRDLSLGIDLSWSRSFVDISNVLSTNTVQNVNASSLGGQSTSDAHNHGFTGNIGLVIDI